MSPRRLVCHFITLTSVLQATPTGRTVSWWLDVAEDAGVDANNTKYIREHRSVFSRVMPYNGILKLDGNLTEWWTSDTATSVHKWHGPLKEMNLTVLPYLIDTSNATQMHLVYANSTAFVQDAVAIAGHYGFQGWFIDYEDEHPVDTDPNKSQKLAAFLTELGSALHVKDMQLTICVASWSNLLADYKTLAASPGVNELQLMSTYANPGNYKSIIDDYFAQVKVGAGDIRKAGVGVGIYYDGHGYSKEWTEDSARAFVKYVADQGGMGIDVFRLSKGATDDWPREAFWFDLFSDFIHGNLVDQDTLV